MDEDELFDVLTAIDSSAVPDTAERFDDEARRLAPGTYGRASLLIAAGDRWKMRGEYDELRHAHRWLTMPLTYADPDDDDIDFLLGTRLRVREALGLARDRFDQVAFEERELRRAELE